MIVSPSLREFLGVLARGGNRIAARINPRVWAWREFKRDHVVIGTLRTDRLAVAIRTATARDRLPPPLQTFLDRLSFHEPYCPRCSLPLEPFSREGTQAGACIGYQCRPCGTQIFWKPADVLRQIKREVRRHYPDYWRTYQDALHQGGTQGRERERQ